ncbi:MAG: hypothetical protein ATN35_02130 [Epulopiscium sp. Nele67-Bin004]|nr:MAG: hypothetical protein ATN35_02130 [Epulopiscium sp. Nele67-Bin004]
MKIYIDAGHRNSTWDRGAVSNGKYESPIALDYAKELENQLKVQGITTYMSRNTEDDIITLQERTNKANALGVDLYVSIHVNAAGEAYKGIANGVEVLYYTDATLPTNICNAICTATGATNRGAKQRKDLHVLRCSTMQAILIEVGFIDNANEIEKVVTQQYRQTVVTAITNTICNDFNISKTATAEIESTTIPTDNNTNTILLNLNGNVKSVQGKIIDGVTIVKLKDLADDKITISYENDMPTVTVTH